jgi:hypothetical protein
MKQIIADSVSFSILTMRTQLHGKLYGQLINNKSSIACWTNLLSPSFMPSNEEDSCKPNVLKRGVLSNTH